MMAEDEIDMLVATLRSRRGGPAMRAQAARLLGERGDARAIEPLLEQIEDTRDPFKLPVVTAVLDALPRFGGALEPALLRLLEAPGDIRRKYVPRLLVSARGAGAAPVLLRLFDDSDEDVAMNAVTALGFLRDPSYAAPLRALVEDTTRQSLMRGVAASALGMTGAPAAYDVLASLLGSDDPNLVAGAIDGLAELGDARAIPLIQALIASGRLEERIARGAKLALISLRSRSNQAPLV